MLLQLVIVGMVRGMGNNRSDEYGELVIALICFSVLYVFDLAQSSGTNHSNQGYHSIMSSVSKWLVSQPFSVYYDSQHLH